LEQDSASAKVKCELINVSSHSLGLVGIHRQTREKINVVLIPKNTPLPCRAVRKFHTARADQRNVCISVVEGENQRPEECISLGKCVVRDLPSGLPQDTPIEVEYSYAANGRISVSARIPTIRQSARVEIKRDNTSRPEDLDSWRKKMLGLPTANQDGFASISREANINDWESVQKQLDVLHIKLGKAAAGLSLPATLLPSQKAALQAAAEFTQMQSHLKNAQSARQTAVDRSEVIRLDALLAQAKAKFHETQTRADFAHLVLGRECIKTGFRAPNMEHEIAEIEQHHKYLKSAKEKADV
jgi:molecular chaperone DnaK